MPQKPVKKRGVSKQAAFLAAFAACASVTEAAKAAKIDRSLHYQWMKDDAKYPALFAAAFAAAGDTLQDEAVERATKGVYEPLVYQGAFTYKMREQVLCTLPDGREVPREALPEDLDGIEVKSERRIQVPYGAPLGIWKKSDRLLEKLMNGFLPERYSTRVQQEISGPAGGPIPLEQKRLAALTDEELTALIATAHKLAESGSDEGGTKPPSAE